MIPFVLLPSALIIAIVITWAVRQFAARFGFLDVPNSRSSHARPTVRGGGIAIVAAYLLAVPLLWRFRLVSDSVFIGLALPSALIALVGFADDRWRISAGNRFSVHVLAAVLALWLLGGLPAATMSLFGQLAMPVNFFLAGIALVWGTNLFNFMDGIDGLAGSEAVFFATSGAVMNLIGGGDAALTLLFLTVAAACLGFLLFNWPPASIFMGDVGSGFLGFTLVALALFCSHSTTIPLDTWLVLGGVFFSDATITLFVRISRGDQWREAHSSHAYQHLARKAGSHKVATLGVSAINCFWLLPWAVCSAAHLLNSHVCLVFALSPLVIGVALLGAGRSAAKDSAHGSAYRKLPVE